MVWDDPEEIERIAVAIFEAGACQDCGCPLKTMDEARAHAVGDDACDAWNEGEGKGMITVLHDDGSYSLLPIGCPDCEIGAEH